MSLRNWVTRIAARQTSKHGRDRKSKSRRFRPILETLEDRCLPSFLVTNLADDGSAHTLRYEIQQAEMAGPGNTVTFQQGLNGTIHLNSKMGALLLNTSVNIDATGANITISGDFASNVFNIIGTASQGVTANLTDLTIEHGINGGSGGLFTNAGGGMVIYFANVTLNQCNVIDNEAMSNGSSDAQGGGIWMDASQLQANKSNITDNIVVGGTGVAEGGGIYALDSSVQLTGGSLLRNKAGGGFGGGVGTNGTSVSAGGNAYGGALFADSVHVLLRGEEIDNNAAFGGNGSRGVESSGLPGGNAAGGALYLSQCGQAQIIACPSHQNKAEGGMGGDGADGINGSQGGDGGAGGDAQGGWIYTNGTSVDMDSVGLVPPYIIQGNEAVGGFGGAGGNGANHSGKGGDGGNGQGGAIYANPGDQILFPQKLAIPLNFNQPWGLIDNTAQGGPGGRGGDGGGAGGRGGDGGSGQGGGVVLNQANSILTGFVGLNAAQGGQGGQGGRGNTSQKVAGNGGNGGNAQGGALFCNAAMATAGISTGPFGVWLNSTTGGQGGTGGEGFNGGNGGNGGSASGGAFDGSGGGFISIIKDFLQYNTANGGAGGFGGGINSDTGKGGMGGAGGSAQGGAVNLDNFEALLIHDTLTSNRSAGGQGGLGGPAINGSAGSGGNGGVGGSSQGGALAVEDSFLVVNKTGFGLINDVFDDNHAVGGSGGSGADGMGLSNVDNGGNGGRGGLGAVGQGGAIFITGASAVSMENTTLSNNSAQGGDGGSGGSTFEVYFILPGVAGSGEDGGNGDGGGLFAAGGTVSLVNNTLSDNKAKGGQGGGGGNNPDYNAGNGGSGGEGRGGGLAAEGANFHLVNNTFNADSAQGGSGGQGGNADDFDIGGTGGDGQPGEGGAIYVNAGTLPLINNTIDGNKAASGNAGAGGNPTFANGAQLPSSGGGIYVDLGISVPNITLTNTIVAQDHADIDPDIAGIIQSGDHDLIGDGTGAIFVTSNMDQIGTSNNPIDPRLMPLANYGGPTLTMIPKPGSPVIDTGDDAALSLIAAAEGGVQQPPTDQRGLKRLVGLHIDVGATEYGVGPTTPQSGPPTNGAPGIGPSGTGIVPPGIPPGHLHLPGEAFRILLGNPVDRTANALVRGVTKST